MGKYLVIKLTDNWITNEQIKSIVKCHLEDYDVKIFESTPIMGVRQIPREAYEHHGESLVEFMKEKLALDIGELLMKEGFITFSEETSREGKKLDIVRLTALLNVVNEKEKENGTKKRTYP